MVVTLALLASYWGSAARAQAGDLMIGAPASFAEAMQSLAADFSTKTKIKVRLSTAASSVLVQQVLRSAPFDVLITADSESMDKVDAAGLIAPGSRRPFIGNRLALIVPSQDNGKRQIAIAGPRDLLKAEVQRVVVADEAVPAGHYARNLLAKYGVWESLRSKVVGAPNVRAALALVMSGAVDAGFVYTTDAALAKNRVAVVFTTDDLESAKIRYEVALLNSSRNLSAGRVFLQNLGSLDVQVLLDKRGFRRL
jgi:molybdate transport system substrate-binding protein